MNTNISFQARIIICLCVVLLSFFFGYAYSESSCKVEEYKKQNFVVSTKFCSGLEMLSTLCEIDSIDLSHWNRIKKASQQNCFILETYDLPFLFDLQEKNNLYMDETIKNFFFELEQVLSSTDFDNMSLSQKEYLKNVGKLINESLNNDNTLLALYEKIKYFYSSF